MSPSVPMGLCTSISSRMGADQIEHDVHGGAISNVSVSRKLNCTIFQSASLTAFHTTLLPSRHLHNQVPAPCFLSPGSFRPCHLSLLPNMPLALYCFLLFRILPFTSALHWSLRAARCFSSLFCIGALH